MQNLTGKNGGYTSQEYSGLCVIVLMQEHVDITDLDMMVSYYCS